MKQHLSRNLHILVHLIVALVLTGLASVSAGNAAVREVGNSACISSGWPQDGSDLQPDPDLHFGRLANGLRYVLRHNREPNSRVAMYLNVQAGSIQETEQQRGLAHFLEHMLFNGTTHFPPGTLVEYFQTIGMGFGGDTNAHTGFDETVYNLLLPSADTEVLAKGFRVLADYARGALLLEEEVGRERGIILAEKRSRDSAESRVAKTQMRFDFAGTLAAERDPIGTEEVLNTADSRLLRSYYDSWYRPENMIVVVVGDMDLDEAKRLLTYTFAGLAGAETEGACPALGMVKESGMDVLFLPETDLGYTGITLATVGNRPAEPDTLVKETELFKQYVSVALLNNRLRQLEQQKDSPLSKSRAVAGIFLQRFNYAAINTRTDAAHWQQGLTLVQNTLTQALQYGFTGEELGRVKQEITALLQKGVQTAASRDSREIAAEIIRKLNSREVDLSPEQEMRVYLPLLEAMTLQEVNVALRQVWGTKRRLVEVVGTADPGLGKGQPEEVIRQVFADNLLSPIIPWEEQQQLTFPYLPAPATVGKVVERIDHKAIDTETTVFDGGVRLNCKKTDFQANQVLLSVNFGGGRQAEPADGMALAAEALLKESGVGKLNREQLEAALAGTNVRLDFRAGQESFSLNGTSLSQELELLLQLVYARLHDSAFTEESFRRGKEQLGQMYEQMASSVEGVYQLQGERFLGGGGHEYGLASWDQLQHIELDQVSGWLRPMFAGAPLEIDIVGDIDPAVARGLVGKYFGDEHRQQQDSIPEAGLVFPAGQQRQLSVNSAIDKALLTVAWQTSDFWDIGKTRRLNVLAAVLDDRLRVKIREELGATYSPQVVSQPSRIRPGFGLLQGRLTVAPEQAESIAEIIKGVAADLGKRGVQEEELKRALEPTLTSIRDYKRTNRYWLEAVLGLSSRHPQQLAWPETISEDFAAIQAGELTELARQYLGEDKAATLIVRPEKK